MGLCSIFVSLIKRYLVTLFIEIVMRSLESVIQVFGERARSAADLGEVCEVILEDVPYFYQQGLLTAEVLCRYFKGIQRDMPISRPRCPLGSRLRCRCMMRR